jgi:hypothetical protein
MSLLEIFQLCCLLICAGVTTYMARGTKALRDRCVRLEARAVDLQNDNTRLLGFILTTAGISLLAKENKHFAAMLKKYGLHTAADPLDDEVIE